MQGYVVAGGLRPVPANGGTTKDAHAYALQCKVYPLADAAARSRPAAFAASTAPYGIFRRPRLPHLSRRPSTPRKPA
jgi:hypothetical protein